MGAETQGHRNVIPVLFQDLSPIFHPCFPMLHRVAPCGTALHLVNSGEILSPLVKTYHHFSHEQIGLRRNQKPHPVVFRMGWVNEVSDYLVTYAW